MGASRETKNIWRCLFRRNYNGEWMGRELFTRRWWRYREYVWQDSFGAYINRWLLCPVLGHRHVRNVNFEMPAEPEDWYCFNCARHGVPPQTKRLQR